MRRFVLIVATVIFLSGSPGPTAGLGLQAQVLPAIDAEGRTLPLTVDQLDPDEQARFAQLSPGGDDARRFLYTRGFLRYCREVAEGRLAPLALPPLPARENWSRQFLSEDEATNFVDVAIGMKLYERMRSSA